jgi:hypothetical protein
MMYKTLKFAFLFLMIWLLILSAYCYGAPTNLLTAIHQVESSGRTGPILGDNGKALGPMQIHYAYWKSARVRGKYSDCADYAYSCKVVTAYWQRYAPRALRTGDYETLARVHNGGPRGYARESTKKYWARVRKVLTS